MAKPDMSGTVISLAFRQVVIPEDFNVRQTYNADDDAALALSIQRQGILSPVLVRRLPDGTYELVAGFRRMRALRAIHGDKVGDVSVPCYVREFASYKDAYIANMSENETRSTVKRYDLADRLVTMRDRFNYKGIDLAKLIGMSNATVSNLMACRTKLAPEIIAHWKAAPTVDAEIPISRLTAWAKYPHDEQVLAFDAYLAEINGDKPGDGASDGDGAGDGDGDGAGDPKGKREILFSLRSKDEIIAMMKELRDVQCSNAAWTDIQEGAIRALEWCLKERDILRTYK